MRKKTQTLVTSLHRLSSPPLPLTLTRSVPLLLRFPRAPLISLPHSSLSTHPSTLIILCICISIPPILTYPTSVPHPPLPSPLLPMAHFFRFPIISPVASAPISHFHRAPVIPDTCPLNHSNFCPSQSHLLLIGTVSLSPRSCFFYAFSYLFFFYVHMFPATSVTPNNISQRSNNLLCAAVRWLQGRGRIGKRKICSALTFHFTNE